MSRFIDLPDELILEISYHLDVEDLSLACKPFHQWASRIFCHINSTSLRNKSIAALASTNKRFYSLLLRTLYHHPVISGVPKTSLSSLKTILITSPNLGKHILSAHITISDKPNFKTCIPIFFLPAIKALSITATSTWNGEYFAPVWLPSLYGMSTLQTLHLISFPVRKQNLREIFRWPRSLKELWFEIDQRWAGYRGNTRHNHYSETIFFNALSPLQTSLERLVLTRSNPKLDIEDGEQVGLSQGYADAVNFRVLEKLKDLRTYEALLVRNGKSPVWSNMPPNLETLEVFYDDSSYIPFLCEDDASNYSWLLDILSCKPNICPKLGRVRVISPEKTPDQWLEDNGFPDDWEDDGSEAMEREVRRLREEGLEVPTVLKEAFEHAGVSYSLYLNKYFKVKQFVFGGTEFEEDWDEGEITQ